MPNPYVKSLAKETGKSPSEIERLWKKAKQITIDTFGTPEVAFGDKEYSYTVGVIKQMAGTGKTKGESLLYKFLRSNKSPQEFIEDAVMSGNFDIGNVHYRGGKDDEDIDEKTCQLQDDNIEDTVPVIGM